ncbi:MAG: hypothetical protein U1F56_24535 [Rubrivivax sp.]
MLDGIKRWLSGSSGGKESGHVGADAFASWSRASQVHVRVAREGEGVIVDGKADDIPWRLEWGASQRPYVLGNELRIRGEIPLPGELQVIVLNRVLQEAIEKTMFEQFVEGVQTRIDTETPAEMRWVVMYPKLKGSELGALRDRYAAAASMKPWLQAWLSGALGQALASLKIDPATAFVLMIGRSKITLRTEVDEASPATIEPHLRVFETALREARRVMVEGAGDKPAGGGA